MSPSPVAPPIPRHVFRAVIFRSLDDNTSATVTSSGSSNQQTNVSDAPNETVSATPSFSPSSSSLPFPYNETGPHHRSPGAVAAIVFLVLFIVVVYIVAVIYFLPTRTRLQQLRIWSQVFKWRSPQPEDTEALRRENARERARQTQEQLRHSQPSGLGHRRWDSDQILVDQILASDPRNRRLQTHTMPAARSPKSSSSRGHYRHPLFCTILDTNIRVKDEPMRSKFLGSSSPKNH
ncbi:hypothetical protein VKT23_006365 [Stygiomarasmius scandens]|uniref:Uncharacterized protein n=1 Tax=Marasmiellus scandens TaxID=2682957 RepID=A0ABR1JNE3_9AGAR